MNRKRLIREVRFQFFFHANLEVNQSNTSELTKETLKEEFINFLESIDTYFETNELQQSIDICYGILQNKSSLTPYFEVYCPKWKPERLSKVDYTVLLMAFYELKFVTQTPYKVIINESVEIAKKFGTQESPQFVNAVIDHFYKKEIEK